MSLKITTLIENTVSDSCRLESEHGLSFFIEKDDLKLLFDTGQSGAFLANAEALKINPADADYVLLSHSHYDHCGGFRALAESADDFQLITGCGFFEPKYSYQKRSYRYLGCGFDGSYLAERGIRHRECFAPLTKLSEGVFVLTDFPRRHEDETINPRFVFRTEDGNRPDSFYDEIMLALYTVQGWVLVLGCCHPGFRNMLDAAKDRLGGRIHAVLGGTHLVEASADTLEETLAYLRASGIAHLGLSHCTGPSAIRALSAAFPSYFHNNCGTVFTAE